MTEISPARAACEAYGEIWANQGSSRSALWEDAAKAAAEADPRWPRCPDGCGCRIGTDDADRSDCGCGGPCTMECRENGYPDALSYRDLATREVTDTVRDMHRAEVDEARAERDAAYRERARLVAFLAACYESGMLTDSAEPDWPVVYVSTPAGQLSWHIAKGDLGLFAHVPVTTDPAWDGHTTEAKYERLAAMTIRIAAAGGLAGIIAALEQIREAAS